MLGPSAQAAPQYVWNPFTESVKEPMISSVTAAPPTDAGHGATLSGPSWLSNLINTGIAGYVAVQTVKNQNRNSPGAVTTQDIPRVGVAPASSGLSPGVIAIGVGVVLLALLAALFTSRK